MGVEKRTKSPDAPGALNAEQPRPKRVKPLAAKKPAAQAQAPAVPVAAEAQAGNASSGAAASDAAAQQAYWQTVRREDRTPTHAWQQYYAQQAAWYPQQAVAPSYFAPSISGARPASQRRVQLMPTCSSSPTRARRGAESAIDRVVQCGLPSRPLSGTLRVNSRASVRLAHVVILGPSRRTLMSLVSGELVSIPFRCRPRFAASVAVAGRSSSA